MKILRSLAIIVSLVVAQSIGLLHGFAHQHTGRIAFHSLHDHAFEEHQEHQEHLTQATSHSWMADMFAGHSEGSTCQVFDQQCHSDAATATATTADYAYLKLVNFFLDTYRGATPFSPPALVQARGPPVGF